MDSNGFLSPRGCEVCQKPLQGFMSGRPAELYAGTFTGLCYECQAKPWFKVPESEHESGSYSTSHPPSCPSHRRDRGIFTAFADCPDCKGDGSQWVSRADSQGGSYRTYCDACHKRHYEHPSVAVLAEKRTLWRGRMQAEWDVLLKSRPDLSIVDTGDRQEDTARFWALPEIKAAHVDLFARGPKEPKHWKDEVVFPEGWAELPKPKAKRKDRRRA